MKKLTRKFEGKSYFLTKSEHESLLKRFDAKKFEYAAYSRAWSNGVGCILCSKYNSNVCRGCTFNKARRRMPWFAVNSTGCMLIVESLLSTVMRCSLTFAISQVTFYDAHRAHALAGIKKVREFLVGFK